MSPASSTTFVPFRWYWQVLALQYMMFHKRGRSILILDGIHQRLSSHSTLNFLLSLVWSVTSAHVSSNPSVPSIWLILPCQQQFWYSNYGKVLHESKLNVTAKSNSLYYPFLHLSNPKDRLGEMTNAGHMGFFSVGNSTSCCCLNLFVNSPSWRHVSMISLLLWMS